MSIIAPPTAEIRCHHHKHGWTFEHRPNLGTFGKISEKLAKQRKFLENWKTKKKFWKIGKPKEELESRVLLVELLDQKTVPPRSSLFLPHWSCRWRSDGRTVYLLYFIFPTILLISAPWMVLWKIMDEGKPKNGPKQGHPSCRVKHPLEMVQSYIVAKV